MLGPVSILTWDICSATQGGLREIFCMQHTLCNTRKSACVKSYAMQGRKRGSQQSSFRPAAQRHCVRRTRYQYLRILLFLCHLGCRDMQVCRGPPIGVGVGTIVRGKNMGKA